MLKGSCSIAFARDYSTRFTYGRCFIVWPIPIVSCRLSMLCFTLLCRLLRMTSVFFRLSLPPPSDCLFRSAGVSTHRQARLRAVFRPGRRGAHARAGRGHAKRWSIGGSDHGDVASLAGDGHACEAGPRHDWRAITNRKGACDEREHGVVLLPRL